MNTRLLTPALLCCLTGVAAAEDGEVITVDTISDVLDLFSVCPVLAPGCDADFNGDGVINTQDVLAFLNAWNAGC